MSKPKALAAVDDTETEIVDFDPNDLTAADAAYIEDYSGTKIADMANSTPSIRTLIAMVYVTMKQTQPDLTVTEVEQMKLNALMGALGNDDAPQQP